MLRCYQISRRSTASGSGGALNKYPFSETTMARKKTVGEETGETPAVKMTKADAVRAAVADGADNPTEGTAYIKAKFNLDITPQQFSTYKALDKKRSGKPARQGRQPKAAVIAPSALATGPVGLAIQVESIKTLVEALGDEQVVSIARLFGK